MVCECVRLTIPSWDANIEMPARAIHRLEQQWPNAKLVVDRHDRADNAVRLLSSPLLYSLKYSTQNHTATVTATDQLAQYSKLPELREILLKSPNLKKLDINFKYNWIEQGRIWKKSTAKPGLLHLPLQPPDRLPTLLELSLSGPPETYEFDLRHCQILSQCMDWSHLRRLDVGISCPQYLFEEIGSRLGNLRSLTMGVRTGNRRWMHWPYGPLTCESRDTVVDFIRSVPGLRELYLTEFDNAAEEVASVIIESQSSLRKLSYLAAMHRSGRGPSNETPYTWTILQLHELRRRNPELVCLELNLPIVKGQWVRRLF